jgi:hypothetical protein
MARILLFVVGFVSDAYAFIMNIEDLSSSRVKQCCERTPSDKDGNPPWRIVAATIDCSPTEQMSPALDRLSLKFAIWAGDAPYPSLDLGCGDGVATISVLARGRHVVAVDPDEVAMGLLIGRIPSEHIRRLKVRLSKLPNLEFKATHFFRRTCRARTPVLDPVAQQCCSVVARCAS